jgi:hypothetical protein
MGNKLDSINPGAMSSCVINEMTAEFEKIDRKLRQELRGGRQMARETLRRSVELRRIAKEQRENRLANALHEASL